MLTVIGMPVVIQEREVVLAREVHTMKGVLIVRDQFGAPLWEPRRPFQMDTEREMRPFEICGISK
jgi:hypothetical protein